MFPHNGSESDKNYISNAMLYILFSFICIRHITYPLVCIGIYIYTPVDIKTHEFISIKLLIAIKSSIYYRREPISHFINVVCMHVFLT